MIPTILRVSEQEHVNLFSGMMRKIYEEGKPDGSWSCPVSDIPVDKIIERTIEPGFLQTKQNLHLTLKYEKSLL